MSWTECGGWGRVKQVGQNGIIEVELYNEVELDVWDSAGCVGQIWMDGDGQGRVG